MNVTDGDRDKAAQALWPLTRYRWPRDEEMTADQRAQWDRVAQALADERERARAPFLAALADLEREVDLPNPHTPGTPGYHGANGLKTGIAYAISKVRRAAEETTE